MYVACYADAYLRVYNTSNNLIQLTTKWASGVTGTIAGIAFFPNDALNHALLAVASSSIVVIQVTSPTAITKGYTFTLAHGFRQIIISPSGSKSLAMANAQNEIDYLGINSYTSITLI